MSHLPPRPRVKLSKLRDIGWNLWDPIGLLGEGGPFTGNWDDEDNLSFADEYDRYLISAASQLREGAAREQVVDYLVQVETEYMALRQGPTTRKRAQDVVEAMLADPDIWTWPDEHGRFL